MLLLLKVLIISVVLNELLKRYVPVIGLSCVELDLILKNEQVALLDVRNFQSAHKHSVEKAINIPLAYLHRNTQQFVGQSIIIVADEKVEVNLSARILKKKGIKVCGYYLRSNQGEDNSYHRKQMMPC